MCLVAGVLDLPYAQSLSRPSHTLLSWSQELYPSFLLSSVADPF